MTSKHDIDDFLAQRKLAIAGVSRSGKKFGNSILREFKARGYEMYPVHPEAEEIDGQACVRSLKELPAEVGGLILVVKPEVTQRLVREAREAGITRVWMQQGAASEDAERYCREQGMGVVSNECVFMFTEPVQGIHGFHRWLWKVIGKLPH
ncbi:CoA-binding protein [bacterium]|nr:CoA-binding protein [bacterium]